MDMRILDDYDAFIKRKASEDVESGFEPSNLGSHLFDFQSAIVEWACKRGRAAIFADTGLGKTAMQTEWARQVTEHTGDLVFSPFTGIGSEGYVSIEMGRKFVGSELKRSYWELATRNLRDARETQASGLFAMEELEAA